MNNYLKNIIFKIDLSIKDVMPWNMVGTTKKVFDEAKSLRRPPRSENDMSVKDLISEGKKAFFPGPASTARAPQVASRKIANTSSDWLKEGTYLESSSRIGPGGVRTRPRFSRKNFRMGIDEI